MKTQMPPKPTPLPGILVTLKAGFDLAARHWWLALLPAVLDLFYWLGPRLSPRELVTQTTTLLADQTMLAEMNQQFLEAAQQTNLFTSLTIPFIGVPTLMRLIPEETPIVTQSIEIQNYGTWLALFLGLTIVGFLLTALYFSLIAQTIRQSDNGRVPLTKFLQHVTLTWGHLLLVGVGFLIASIIIFIPLLAISALLSLINPQLIIVVVLSGMMFIFWLAIFLGFTPHGLTLNQRTLSQALVESFQLVRLNYVSTITLLLVLTAISTLMNQLMLYADDGSWLTLSSILGHAFISTALVATSYVFYKDRIAIQLVAQRQPMPTDQIEETSNG